VISVSLNDTRARFSTASVISLQKLDGGCKPAYAPGDETRLPPAAAP